MCQHWQEERDQYAIFKSIITILKVSNRKSQPQPKIPTFFFGQNRFLYSFLISQEYLI